ncbi:hypothetical protein QRX25_14735 [Bacillus sp. L381]|uniref:hypothetical protein n=1 Tax=Bacillus TaxID=1386 RepID=UPI001BA569EE|nr:MULTISPECIES: hypothetical protein [Bacillus]MCR9040841.1 hypothetical protein [Bacillus velezensis]QUN08739.1 hypothetical protein KEF49_14535 [Bacillus amyloliquefaciens]QYM81811.1 hypothetical protein KTJ85_14380 [Bacillus sp. 7D3]QZY10957.1 hypothetical protein K7B13_14635 [Bacillus amyloliquefaciens]WIX20857.1 hypothetical protein QRX25_14735 [Bacillus sp. L381]
MKRIIIGSSLALSLVANGVLGVYLAKANDDADVAYRVADDMAHEAKIAQESIEREYIVEGKDYAVSADDGGFAFDPKKANVKPGDRISVTFTRDQYENGNGYQQIKVIE